MGREVRRVPVDFRWPLNKTWTGFFLPEHLRSADCPDCDGGWSIHYKRLSDRWYGYSKFDPAETGSTPFTVDTPAVRARAERNAAADAKYYGSGEATIVREAQRLAGLFGREGRSADLWNGMWMHHLSQDDVDILVADDRLRDLTHTFTRGVGWEPRDPMPKITAAQVNEWSLDPMSFCSSDLYVVAKEYLRRAGLPLECETCSGVGGLELWPGQAAAAEAWESVEPPTGDGWQLWETVSEGSPISPPFATPEELAEWMSSDAYTWGTSRPMQYDAALRFVNDGWAPSFVMTPETGFVAGEVFVGRDQS